MESLILHCALLLTGISIIAGIIGPFIIWKHMACFTDTMSHTALIAFILSSIIGIPSIFMVFFISATLSIAISHNTILSTNTMLTIINSSTFAVSMIVISLFPNIGIQISSLLFGDILLTSLQDVILIYILAIVIIFIAYFRWKEWLIIVISEDIAKVENINVNWIKIEFILIISIFISFIMHIIGTLLVSALIIIPAATARIFATRPKYMVILSAVICMISSFIGLSISFVLDITTSATVISFSILCFALCYFLFLIKNKISLKKS